MNNILIDVAAAEKREQELLACDSESHKPFQLKRYQWRDLAGICPQCGKKIHHQI